MLEKMQRRFARCLLSWGALDMGERWDRLGLFSLVWWQRDNLIEVYNILGGLNRVEIQNVFTPSEISKTRGHSERKEF